MFMIVDDSGFLVSVSRLPIPLPDVLQLPSKEPWQVLSVLGVLVPSFQDTHADPK